MDIRDPLYREIADLVVETDGLTVKKVTDNTIETVEDNLSPEEFATGDYYCTTSSGERRKIAANTHAHILGT